MGTRRVVALAILACGVVHAEPLPDRTDRVIGLARVWAKVKLFHPYLAYKDLDWDAPLIAAIPRAEAATTVAEYRAALQDMLAALHDPVTRLVDAPASKPPTGDWLTTPAPGVLRVGVAALVGTDDLMQVYESGGKVVALAAKAKALVVDLRGAKHDPAMLAISQLAVAFPPATEWPLERSLEHRGYRSQADQISEQYDTTFVTSLSHPQTGSQGAVPHVVFVLDRASAIPSAALALQAAGRATLVSDGPLDEANAVTTTTVALPAGLVAQVRIGELLWSPPAPDIVAKSAEVDARALAIATSAPATARPRAHAAPALPLPRARDDLDYADRPYPARELRMLGAIEMWAVIDSVYPYRYLIADWDAALRDGLAHVAAAKDRDAYLDALREMGAAIGDGHVAVLAAHPDPTSRSTAPVDTRLIDGKLTAIRVLDKATIAVGDVIETIDGAPAAARLAALRKVTSAGTDESRDQMAAGRVLRGRDGTAVKLGLRDARGALREVSVVRTIANAKALWDDPPPGAHWKKLDGGRVGYVDLNGLTVAEVPAMFDDFKATRAIVFDMRGYPNATGPAIVPRINTNHATHGNEYLTPLASGRGDPHDQRARYFEELPALPKDASLYRGKVVVLIDDRAVSQAEDTCMQFEAAASPTFVGSPTHGTDGGVTYARLPGGLRFRFTGQEIRHADGRQLQRIGIQPQVVVRPTLAGIRAGKDEVLDRALAWISSH
jgi:hypothetical protein